MTYEQKAELFTKALSEAGGNIAAALKAVDRAARRPPDSRLLGPVKSAEVRRRRAAGEKLAVLAADHGVSETVISRLCRGIRRGKTAAARTRKVATIAEDVIRILGAELDLLPGWERIRRQGFGPPTLDGLARRAAVLALRAAGCAHADIAEVLGRDHSSIVKMVPVAQSDPEALRLAALVAERLAPAEAAAEERAA